MPFKISKLPKIASALIIASSIALCTVANATVVEIRTNMGNIQVNLFDQTTPRTVENFLSYINAGAYAGMVSHRSVPDFIVQMGGFQYGGVFPPDPIATSAAIINEPELSNLRGTLAMAKLGGNANSATSQFFINVADNSSNLDVQNGGFTVFGQVIGNGMEVADAINALSRFAFASPFNEIPLRNYTQDDINNDVEPNDSHLVIVTDIVVIDPDVNTNPNLNPAPNTLINEVTNPSTPSSGSSGGSLGLGFLFVLCLISLKRRVK